MNDQLTQIKLQIMLGLLLNPQQVMLALQSEQGQLILQALAQAAQQGDEESAQIIQAVQSIAQQGAQMARKGAKLNYLRSLKDQCPEGTELQFFKAGGRVCSKCMKKKAEKGAMIESEKCGGKKKAMTKAMEGIKIEMAKCGKKVKKSELGGKNMSDKQIADKIIKRKGILENKCGGKTKKK